MIRRFRMVAGPNGSGKTTLVGWLTRNYAVNFYTMLNADDVFARVRESLTMFSPFPIDGASLMAYVDSSQYDEAEKDRFRSGEIVVEEDCVRFASQGAVNSYTVALLVNFLQDEYIARGISFSQETVFSHPSKVAALAKAHHAGFRTYLYYVATDDAAINADRVARRYAQGGHDVPPEKIAARYGRSLANVAQAIPYLSRAFFFDNSNDEMRYLASYENGKGLVVHEEGNGLPYWFKTYVDVHFKKPGR